MSSSNSAAAAQYITAYQEEATINVLAIVATVLLLYDTLLTSGQECRYIWRSGTSWVSRLLYVWNRYMSPLYLSLNLGTIPSISDAR
ncbi:hypothetical protein TRAPUB_5355 [Trametes pubescens]|uniref:DUF6533 domain-containing protein n=1 Tax=Trametes pubescens TaxID=154538 RepID=A0A1M2V8Q0_TRAPU|nr:hypothetical protein TRAPUB_5355 [Trametes pubescens]